MAELEKNLLTQELEETALMFQASFEEKQREVDEVI
jgi:hypothetical protein